jgi:hypothetical protein
MEVKLEEWRPVKGFEGLYEVSDEGRVRSLDRLVKDKTKERTRLFKGRILNNICMTTGYHMVSLHKNNKRVSRRTVHRLVMEAFCPTDSLLNIVDHKDGNRSNNKLENLRWVDFFTNNNNTPYIRYLQKLLQENNIEFIGEDKFGRTIS